MEDTVTRCYSPNSDYLQPHSLVNYHGRQFPEIEREIMYMCGLNTPEQVSTFYDQVDAARVKWACISAKTQREFSGGYDSKMVINVFENLTEFRPFHHSAGNTPPSREGEQIHEFSARSHSRMMQRFRKMKKSDLPLPYFVTLTYGHNMRDFETAKKHLNVFFQRFRRLDRKAYYIINPKTGRKNKRWKRANNFRYAWKMEPQKRGAIHFHLMLFLSPEMFPSGAWADQSPIIDGAGYRSSKALEYVRMKISSVWNEISGQAYNFTPQRTKNGRKFGNFSLMAGTNARECYSWEMATGYLAEYMKKEVSGNIWGGEYRVSEPLTDWRPHPLKAFRPPGQIKKYPLDTGRFWGFSYNFDFSVYYQSVYDLKEIEKTREFLYEVTTAAFSDYQRRERENLKRLELKRTICKDAMEKFKLRIITRYKRQKQRYIVNLEKIEIGACIQLEIAQSVTREIIPET